MIIEFQNLKYDLKEFLFQKIDLAQDYVIIESAFEFLTKWISGGKVFELNTSGSSGKEKTIRLERKWLEVSALQTIERLKLWDEKVICCLSTQKIGGLMMLVRSLAGGFDLRIQIPSADPMQELQEDHPYTFISLVPYQLQNVLENRNSLRKLNRFRTLLVGGSALSGTILSEVQKLKPDVYHTYGMTETCSHIALKRLNKEPWPYFKLNPYIQTRTNAEGLLSVTGFQTGGRWIDTHDIVKMYSDTEFEFIGRADQVINTGSYKVFPESLENEINNVFVSNTWKSEVAISSVPDPKWGEVLVLIVQPSLAESDENILNELKNKLKFYEVPKRILRLPEIPKLVSGKTDRVGLRNAVFGIG